MLPIKKSDNFLDLGAGTGYITIPAAKVVEGMVYALDTDSNMLEVVIAKAKKKILQISKHLKVILMTFRFPTIQLTLH